MAEAFDRENWENQMQGAPNLIKEADRRSLSPEEFAKVYPKAKTETPQDAEERRFNETWEPSRDKLAKATGMAVETPLRKLHSAFWQIKEREWKEKGLSGNQDNLKEALREESEKGRAALRVKVIEDVRAQMNLSAEDVKELEIIADQASDFSRNIDPETLREVGNIDDGLTKMSDEELSKLAFPFPYLGSDTMPVLWNKFINARNEHIADKLRQTDTSTMSEDDISKLKQQIARNYDIDHSEITLDSHPLRVRDMLDLRKMLRGSMTSTEDELYRIAIQSLGAAKDGQQVAFRGGFENFLKESQNETFLEYEKVPMNKQEFLASKLKSWSEHKKYRDKDNAAKALRIEALELGLPEGSTADVVAAKRAERDKAAAEKRADIDRSDWERKRASFVEVGAAAGAETEWGRARLRKKLGKQFDESEPMPGAKPLGEKSIVKPKNIWNPLNWFKRD